MEKVGRVRQIVLESGWRELNWRLYLRMAVLTGLEGSGNDNRVSDFLFGGPEIVLRENAPECDDVQTWARQNSSELKVLNGARSFDRRLPPYHDAVLDEFYLPRVKGVFAGKYLCRLQGARIVGKSGLCILPDGCSATESVYGSDMLGAERASFGEERCRLRAKRGVYFSLVDLWDQRAGKNYYHWMHDVVARLYLVLDELPPETLFIVRQDIAPFGIQSLELLGIDRLRLRYIQPDEIWQLEFCYFTPPSHHSGNDVPWVADWFRTRFQRAAGVPAQIPRRRLFISRRNARSRRIVNAAEFEELLTAQNFKICCLEELSVREQVRLFAQAELIVGVQGAGLMNLWFVPAGGSVLEILEPSLVHNSYVSWTLCDALDLTYFSMFAISVPNDSEYPDVCVPMERFRPVFERMMQAHERNIQ